MAALPLSAPAPVYLGDEVSVAGWRLTGVDALACTPREVGAALERALANTSLVFISSALAAHLPAATLRAALAATAPLLVLLPDPAGEVVLPDLASRLRQQLGLEG